MSKGMLGNSEALRRFLSGPLTDLAVKLNSDEGPVWDRELARFLRKEPTWAQSLEQAVFSLTFGDGRSAEELLKAGNYDWVGKYARKFVHSKEFPIATDAGTEDIVLVELDHDSTSQDVLAEFARGGLVRPRPEDALRFGEKYPEAQRKAPIVFLHEPWRGPDGGLNVLVLLEHGSKRELDYYWFDNEWVRHYRFAARRSRK